MTVSEYYQQALQSPNFHHDPVQEAVVKILQHSFERLVQQSETSVNESLSTPISIYLWGSVGRGKSFLMDAFYHCIPVRQKRRVHFYRFMQEVHRLLAEHQGQTDPLIDIAKHIAGQTRVLCFDEFFVSDIGDAMLLSGLIRPLFDLGVVIVATSNVEPTRLYENGLQRQRFLVAIAAIEANMQVVELDGLVDHRLHCLAASGSEPTAYFMMHDASQVETMQQHFIQGCDGQYQTDVPILIEHRHIQSVFHSATQGMDAVWFEFDQLCKGPRSQNDYIALADRYQRIYISKVPQMGGALTDRNIAQGTEDGANGSELAQMNTKRQQLLVAESKSDDEARRFVTLVDEFYDHKVKLYLSAEVPIVELYLGGRVKFEFERTVSRLIEMQSAGYLDE